MAKTAARADASQVDLIREAFHYQRRFDGSTMVFKIDFPVTEGPLFPSLAKDLALLAGTGFRVVIVPGAKERIDAVLREYGVVSRYLAPGADGADSLAPFAVPVRITTAQAMPFVEMAAFHAAAKFMTGLAGSRADAVTGNFVRARGLGVVNGVSMEHSGAVDRFYTDSLSKALGLGMVPILPCIAWSPSGRPYNVPSDEIALQAAVSLGAAKLFIVSLSGGVRAGAHTLPPGVETGEGGRAARLTPQEAERILELNRPSASGADAAAARPLSELALALRAARAGVERVHIISGDEEGAVLRELFSNSGSGTMLHADEYESIRPIKSKDIPDILRLMEPLMQQGALIRRGAEDIQQRRDDYAVFVIDNRIHACGALRDWGGGQGEIAALATDPAYADKGLGTRLVRYFLDKARKLRLRRVFALTTKTQDWFETLGFTETAVETLPPAKSATYDRSRGSLIFARDIE
jgi:amino-acid N-acetyltransferase